MNKLSKGVDKLASTSTILPIENTDFDQILDQDIDCKSQHVMSLPLI